VDAALSAPRAPVAAAAATLACALAVEERAARAGGARAARIGLGASLPLPAGPLVGFGLAGALVPGLAPGTLVSATRVVDPDGEVLWEGELLTVPGAREGVVCAAAAVVDDPAERARLAARTGAIAIDLESGPLAASGRLAGVVRAIADGPERPLGRLAAGSTPAGGLAWGAVLAAFLLEPVTAARAARASRQALRSLERAAAWLARAAS
jgi:nucleoside phosphorylase